jgi:hypothetical protein
MNKKINEGISGVYPNMTLTQEALSAVFTLAFFMLPVLFEYFRMSLSKPQTRDLANKIVQMVKGDNSPGTLKQKIVRATNSLIQKMSSKPVSLEKEINVLVPDNVDKKDEQELTNEIKRNMMGLKTHRQPRNFRG